VGSNVEEVEEEPPAVEEVGGGGGGVESTVGDPKGQYIWRY